MMAELDVVEGPDFLRLTYITGKGKHFQLETSEIHGNVHGTGAGFYKDGDQVAQIKKKDGKYYLSSKNTNPSFGMQISKKGADMIQERVRAKHQNGSAPTGEYQV